MHVTNQNYNPYIEIEFSKKSYIKLCDTKKKSHKLYDALGEYKVAVKICTSETERSN